MENISISESVPPIIQESIPMKEFVKIKTMDLQGLIDENKDLKRQIASLHQEIKFLEIILKGYIMMILMKMTTLLNIMDVICLVNMDNQLIKDVIVVNQKKENLP